MQKKYQGLICEISEHMFIVLEMLEHMFFVDIYKSPCNIFIYSSIFKL